MSFLNAALLAGLLAVLIPPIVHLFNRRKYDEVDWAAMMFLRVSPKTRRKVVLEQLMLMLLRMAAIAVLVLGVGSPAVTSSFFNRFVPRGEQDVVILIDGSASMAYRHGGKSAADAAKEWAAGFIDRMRSGDRVAILHARQQPVPLLGTLSADREQAKNALELLTDPRGAADWPSAVQQAFALLETARPERNVIVLTDGQRYGWADEETLARWDLVARAGADGPTAARVWAVNVQPDRPPDPGNWAVDPLVTGRGVASAGREVRFRSALRFSGSGPQPKPGRVKLEIDGRPVADAPTVGTAEVGPLPVQFAHKFTPGSHLVSLSLDPDNLPGDNRQDFALEVLPAVPVLIVDGDPKPDARYRGSDFLRDALAPAKDPTPGFLTRTVSIGGFSNADLLSDVRGPGTAPRVVVLSNLARLSADQYAALERYLNDGGAVLIAVGDRTTADAVNRTAFRGGQGWLPARLVEPIGRLDRIDDAPRPQPAGFTHPALDLFREPLPGGLHTAYFPRRWRVDTAAGANGTTGTAIAVLTNGDPLLVERGFGRGRVILCTVPLDNGWRTNLHTLPDFVRLAHELVYYLAGGRAAERNLSPGQPIVFSPRSEEPPAPVTVQPPDAAAKVLPVRQWPAVFDATRDPGAYRLTTAAGRAVYFAVRNDPRESVLTPAGEDDRKRVAEAVADLQYVLTPDDIDARRSEGPQTREVWWLLLGAVLALLAWEVWYTRRLSGRGRPVE